jgi:hypothetical protein
MSDGRVRERLNRLAWLLDSSIPIPGTGLSIGLDALIGLFPVLGDLIGVALSGYIIKEAHALGASRAVLARMAFNVAVEGIAGLVPVAGDIFDAAWKANQRNVRLLDAWLARPHKAERGSRLFMAGLALALLAFMAACVALAWLLLRWLAGLAA